MSEGNEAGSPRRQTLDDILAMGGRRDLRRLPRLIGEAFSLVWAASRRQLLFAGGLQVASGLSLAGQLLVARRILESFDLASGVPDVGVVVPELVMFGLLLVIVATAGAAQREQQRVLTEAVTKYTTGCVLDVATTVDLIDFDRPGFYDRLERARVNASARPLQIAQGVLGLLGSGAAVLAVGVTLLFVEPLVAVTVLVGGLPAIFFNRLSARVYHAFTVEQTPGDRRRAYLFQILSRKDEAHEVRAFDSQTYLRAEHDRVFDRRIAATRRLARRRMLYGIASGLIAALVTVAAIVLLLVFIRAGRIGLGDAAVALGALLIVAGRIRTLIMSTGTLYEGALFLTEFTDFVAMGKRRASQRGRTTSLEPFHSLELSDVAFAYPSREAPSLHDVSLRIERGEVIALVGENGSGKTTLTKILAGLYRPTKGTVTWDGADLSDVDLSAMRDHVTAIFQDFARYFLTAEENIGISRHSYIDQQERVRAAAHKAGADRFIDTLPDGYASLLGPAFVGGSDLSLGQWQRMALARAYFRDAPLLILDEPTASLDPRGEFEIFQQVRALAAGNTVVLVSHRFSNVRIADRIVVLDAGRIVEVGNHDQLIAEGGLYAELFDLQAQGYRPAGDGGGDSR